MRKRINSIKKHYKLNNKRILIKLQKMTDRLRIKSKSQEVEPRPTPGEKILYI